MAYERWKSGREELRNSWKQKWKRGACIKFEIDWISILSTASLNYNNTHLFRSQLLTALASTSRPLQFVNMDKLTSAELTEAEQLKKLIICTCE